MDARNRTILLLEDDISVRSSLAQLLADHGYVAQHAGSLAEARRHLDSDPCPVWLLDVNLPDGNGLDLLKDAATRKLPVRAVILTAFPPPRIPPRRPAVVIACLTKPVSPADLLDAIGRAFADVPTSRSLDTPS